MLEWQEGSDENRLAYPLHAALESLSPEAGGPGVAGPWVKNTMSTSVYRKGLIVHPIVPPVSPEMSLSSGSVGGPRRPFTWIQEVGRASRRRGPWKGVVLRVVPPNLSFAHLENGSNNLCHARHTRCGLGSKHGKDKNSIGEGDLVLNSLWS